MNRSDGQVGRVLVTMLLLSCTATAFGFWQHSGAAAVFIVFGFWTVLSVWRLW